MAGCDELLRRRFIAIATDEFVASGDYPRLDVVRTEVAILRNWLCDPNLASRRFTPDFEALAERPSFNDIRRALAENRFGDGDAVVLYITGHGVTYQGRHRIILFDTDPTAVPKRSLPTIDLVEWIAAQSGLDHVLMVIDVCQAGDVAFEITKELDKAIPETWLVLLSTSAGADAKVGAFTGVVETVLNDIRTGTNSDASEIEPYIDAHVFTERVGRLLRERHGQQLRVLGKEPYGASCCLPNPKYDPSSDRVKTDAARSDLAILAHDLTAHWRRRAPVKADERQAIPWVFTGRARLMRRVIAAATGPAASIVVAGRPGSGKSAALARLVTCSDPLFRAEHRDLLAAVPPVPPEDAVDIAVLATGKGPEEIAGQIGGALGAQPALEAGGTALDSWLKAIRDALERRGRPITVVLDALDESSDPVGVVRTVLQPLNPPGNPSMRLLVGVRSIPDDAISRDRPRDMADLTVEALGAQSVAVDSNEYWEAQDLRTLVAQSLEQPPSPYAGRPDVAAELAAAIENGVGRSYLLGLLIAGELANREEVFEPNDTRLHELLAGGIAEIVRQDLTASFPDPDERERAVVLLRVAALAFGRGVPWRAVWPAAASAIAPNGRTIGDADVEWLLRHRVAGYLVRDLEDDITVYRPFHDALRSSLAREIDRYKVDPADHPDHARAHGLIARALLTHFDRTREQLPPPYARRHLVEHIAEAGEVDLPFISAETLPLLDPAAVSRAVRMLHVDPESGLGVLLGAWRGVRHRWSWDRPESNATALDMALTAAGHGPVPRLPRKGLSWTPRWAQWSSGGTVVGKETRRLQAIAFGPLGGRSCIVTAGTEEAQIWDAATNERLGPAVPLSTGWRIMVAPSAEGEMVVAATGRGLGGWDALTGRVRWAIRWEEGGWRAGEVVKRRVIKLDDIAVTTGFVDDRSVVAIGTAHGRVHMFDPTTGERIGKPIGRGSKVAALAVTQDARGSSRLIIARRNGTVDQWRVHVDPPSRRRLKPLVAEINAGPGLSDVAVASYRGEPFIATATSDGAAQLWHGNSGAPAGPSCPHDDEVLSVALVEESGRLLMGTGARNEQAVLWDPLSGRAYSELPHPGSVHDVAFGVVDGRVMLATACSDGNARLWDAIRPSPTRVAARGRVWRCAITNSDDGPLLAGEAENGRVVVWHAESGDQLYELTLLESLENVSEIRKGWPTQSALEDLSIGQLHGRVIVAAATQWAAEVWDVTDDRLLGRQSWHEDRQWPQAAVAVDESAVLVAHGAWDGPVEVADVIQGRRRFSTAVRHGKLLGLGFLNYAGSARLLAVKDEDGLELLDVQTGARRWPRIPRAALDEVSWDGNLSALVRMGNVDVLAFAGPSAVGLWNLAEGQPFGAGFQSSGYPRSVSMLNLAGQNYILTGQSASVRLWNPRTGRLVSELPFGTRISSVAVTPTDEGRALVAVSGPGIAVAEMTAV